MQLLISYIKRETSSPIMVYFTVIINEIRLYGYDLRGFLRRHVVGFSYDKIRTYYAFRNKTVDFYGRNITIHRNSYSGKIGTIYLIQLKRKGLYVTKLQ